MELSNYLVSWVVTYLGDLQPTYIGVIIYLLSTMDILVFFGMSIAKHHIDLEGISKINSLNFAVCKGFKNHIVSFSRTLKVQPPFCIGWFMSL